MESENSFTKMKAILEALRKEVSQINAGTPDAGTPNLNHIFDTSSQQRTRNASSQTMFESEWSQGIQELQKTSLDLRTSIIQRDPAAEISLDLRRDRYKFGRNKIFVIIRERERNLTNCWNAFHSKTSKWTKIF